MAKEQKKNSSINVPKPKGTGYNGINEGFNKVERPTTRKAMPTDSHPQPPKPKPKK